MAVLPDAFFLPLFFLPPIAQTVAVGFLLCVGVFSSQQVSPPQETSLGAAVWITLTLNERRGVDLPVDTLLRYFRNGIDGGVRALGRLCGSLSLSLSLL